MFTHGQRVERSEVESWVASSYPFSYFRADVSEKEEPEHNRIRITITITGPNGEPLVANNRRAVYFSLKPMVGMPQVLDDWTS